MISLLKILFEQEATATTTNSSSSSSGTDSSTTTVLPVIQDLSKKIKDIDDRTKQTEKTLLSLKKKPETPTKADASTGTTQTGKTMPTTTAGRQVSATTDKKQQQPTNMITSKDLDALKQDLLGAMEKKKEN